MAIIKTSLQIDNFLPQLTRALERSFSPQSKQREVNKQAEPLSRIILTRLMAAAPSGERWTEPDYRGAKGVTISHGRPSERQHGVTLEKGWADPDIEDTAEGADITILTNAPHLKILTDGSPGHRIPLAGETPLSFWHFRENSQVFATHINNHPGFQQNTFVEDEMNKLQPTIMTALHDSIKGMVSPIRALLDG